jgi:hypothetical protein
MTLIDELFVAWFKNMEVHVFSGINHYAKREYGNEICHTPNGEITKTFDTVLFKKSKKESQLWQQVLDYFSKICMLPGKQFSNQQALFYLALKCGQ